MMKWYRANDSSSTVWGGLLLVQTMLMALLERHVGRRRSDMMSENWKYSLVSLPALVSLLAYVACHFGEGSIVMVVDRDAVVFEEVVQHSLSCTFLIYMIVWYSCTFLFIFAAAKECQNLSNFERYFVFGFVLLLNH